MTPGKGEVTLRPVTEIDRARIARWLKDAHVQRWLGSEAAAEAEIRLALDSASAICRIVMLGGEAIGYVHALDGAMLNVAPPYGLPAGSWEAALFIALPAHRGKGHGTRALQLIAREVFSTTFAPAISLQVSVRNEAAVRGYERAGFRWIAIVEDPITGPRWLMRMDRP